MRSFCRQDYPEFQIVFGVGDAGDPAIEVAKRLQSELPALSIDVVIDPQQHGHNRKMSSLINMLKYARHDMLVMADSDAFVGPDYLASVTALRIVLSSLPARDLLICWVWCRSFYTSRFT